MQLHQQLSIQACNTCCRHHITLHIITNICCSLSCPHKNSVYTQLVDLHKLETTSLKRYRRAFQLGEVDAAAPKADLVTAVQRHFTTQVCVLAVGLECANPNLSQLGVCTYQPVLAVTHLAT
jgi:hypothetical protein